MTFIQMFHHLAQPVLPTQQNWADIGTSLRHPRDVPSVDPSTLGRKTPYTHASLKYCYNVTQCSFDWQSVVALSWDGSLNTRQSMSPERPTATDRGAVHLVRGRRTVPRNAAVQPNSHLLHAAARRLIFMTALRWATIPTNWIPLT